MGQLFGSSMSVEVDSALVGFLLDQHVKDLADRMINLLDQIDLSFSDQLAVRALQFFRRVGDDDLEDVSMSVF